MKGLCMIECPYWLALSCYSAIKSWLTLYVPGHGFFRAALSCGIFPRQEYWTGWPFPSQGSLTQGEPVSPASADSVFT